MPAFGFFGIWANGAVGTRTRACMAVGLNRNPTVVDPRADIALLIDVFVICELVVLPALGVPVFETESDLIGSTMVSRDSDTSRIRFVTTQTGVEGMMGKEALFKLSRLRASIALVTTLGS